MGSRQTGAHDNVPRAPAVDDGVDRALRYEVVGWATDDIKGAYERITPEMRKRRVDKLQARFVQARKGTHWDQRRKRT
ncbi:hypothetical protein [Streptomyces sp. B5E4]|uniref:hypothetical protein n=1 Tax=Streptomyces sp. B5E4 TaxID=3153568 RepID=UPI00325E995E